MVALNLLFQRRESKGPEILANPPHKDQILAEIAEEWRRATGAEEKRREDKQAAKLAPAEAEGDVQTLAGPSTAPGMKGTGGTTQPAVSDNEDAPISLNPEYPKFQAIFERSDIILHVLDARDPLSLRSSRTESLVNKKPQQRLVFVLNKTGACLLKPAKAAGRLE